MMPRPGENYHLGQFTDDCRALASFLGQPAQEGFRTSSVYEDTVMCIKVDGGTNRVFLYDKTNRGLLKIELTRPDCYDMLSLEIREHVLRMAVKLDELRQSYYGTSNHNVFMDVG